MSNVLNKEDFTEKYYNKYKDGTIIIVNKRKLDDFISTYKSMKMECEDQNKSMEKIYEIIDKHIDID